MRTLSIRSLLVILAVAIALPIVIFVFLLVNQLNRSDQAALERRTIREVGAISSAVELILIDMKSTLDLVASAPELDVGALKEFHYRTGEILEGSGKFVIVVDENGHQLLNTRVPFESRLGQISDLSSLKQALETEETVVSDMFFGKTSGRYVFNVIKPLPISATSKARALIITRNAEELSVAIESQDIPKDWKVAVVDSKGEALATSDPVNVPRGKTVEAFKELKSIGFNGIVTDEDTQTLLGFSPVSVGGWSALKWGPLSSARSSLFDNWQGLLAGGGIILLLLISVSVYAAEKLSKAIGRLARIARAVGDGEVVPTVHSHIKEIDVVAVALAEASSRRSEAEQRTNVVMRELAHRTKNLMALLIAMTRQTARYSDDVEEMAKSLSDRVMAMGASVDLLTSGSIGRVSLRSLVESQLKTFADSPDRITIEGDDLELSGDIAQQLGMAFHELATNAAKYGALSRPNGQIRISWSSLHAGSEPAHEMKIMWTEVGGPPVKKPTRKGFGQVVIREHLEAVARGKVDLAYEPSGLEWSLTAPLDALTGDET